MVEKNEKEKTLEMRVAELEDKLKGLQVTEEEMRAFNKVSALMGGGSTAGATGVTTIPTPDNCVVQQCIRACTVVQQCIVQQCIRACTIVQQCTVVQQCIRACTIRACTIVSDCINECGGGCAPGGGGFSGGGFGSLGG